MMAPETVVTVDSNRPQQPPPQQQEGGALGWLKINIEYFKSPPGILKIIELVTSLFFYISACNIIVNFYYSEGSVSNHVN